MFVLEYCVMLVKTPLATSPHGNATVLAIKELRKHAAKKTMEVGPPRGAAPDVGSARDE